MRSTATTNHALSAAARRGLNAVLKDAGFEAASPNSLLDEVLGYLEQLDALTADKATLSRELEAMSPEARQPVSHAFLITRQKI